MSGEPRWYASLFVGWVGPSGRSSWIADVVLGLDRGLGVEQRFSSRPDGAADETKWTALPDVTPAEAIAWARSERDALVAARSPQEGAPVLSDVLIDELGGVQHMAALHRACMPVWAEVGRRPWWKPPANFNPLPLVVAALLVIAAAMLSWWIVR